MLKAAEVATLSPERISAGYVLIPVAARITGYSVRAIQIKIARGVWLPGHEYRRRPDGEIEFDIDGFNRWVEGRRLPHPKPSEPVAVREPVEAKPEPTSRAIKDVPTALYRHFDAEGLLLYVGVSLRPLGRLCEHRDSSHWVRSIARVTMEWFDSRPEALAAELRAIQTEGPAHNIAGKLQ